MKLDEQKPTTTYQWQTNQSHQLLQAHSCSQTVKNSSKSQLICEWIPTGKDYPKLMAQWVKK